MIVCKRCNCCAQGCDLLWCVCVFLACLLAAFRNWDYPSMRGHDAFHIAKQRFSSCLGITVGNQDQLVWQNSQCYLHIAVAVAPKSPRQWQIPADLIRLFTQWHFQMAVSNSLYFHLLSWVASIQTSQLSICFRCVSNRLFNDQTSEGGNIMQMALQNPRGLFDLCVEDTRDVDAGAISSDGVYPCVRELLHS